MRKKVPQIRQVPYAPQPSHRMNSCPLLSSSARDFFHDSAWLNIPPHRKADILIEPCFPRFGLLGGSSASDSKMSKLAALAARRRQKENEKQQNSVEASGSSLSRLGITMTNQLEMTKDPPLQPHQNSNHRTISRQTQDPPSVENRPTSSPSRLEYQRIDNNDQPDTSQAVGKLDDLQAHPSLFASTLIGFRHSASLSLSDPLASTSGCVILPFDFSKPSPDEVVLKAQGLKGPR